MRTIFLAHGLVRKPVPTFRGHALVIAAALALLTCAPASACYRYHLGGLNGIYESNCGGCYVKRVGKIHYSSCPERTRRKK